MVEPETIVDLVKIFRKARVKISAVTVDDPGARMTMVMGLPELGFG